MGFSMIWHTGLRRLRLVGTVALVLGVICCASVFVTHAMGYAPDPSVASLFSALWPIGLGLVVLGGMVWVTAWVLHGFVPAAAVAEEREPRRGHPTE